ncbi:MAG: C40 family peptidase [Bacilli bacterium]|nr:C40 family peptidase [Bacilli bacterium]
MLCKFTDNNIDILRLKIKKLAVLQLGKPYVHYKWGPDQFDCSGLTWYVYKKLFDIDITTFGYGRSATTWQMTSPIGNLTVYEEGNVTDQMIGKIGVGDILFFHTQSLKAKGPRNKNYYPGHCGIYLGEKVVIHASLKEEKVVIEDLTESKLQSILVGSKNYIVDKKEYCKIKIKDQNH